jgi:hypothetical protein
LESWGFNRPEREIALALAGPIAPPAPAGAKAPATPAPAPTTRVLQLGTDANRSKVYARVASPELRSFIYAVDVDLAADFPLQPVAWRDRALPALPANARIIAVKLTDRVSGETLLDAQFNEAGEPAVPVRDIAALRTVLANVRAPRAKTFQPGAFADRLVVDGEERAWRYQLEATVLLPGGAASEQATKRTFFFLDRTGGAEQFAGSKEFDAIFSLEQPFLDAFWQLTNAPRDPVPPAGSPAENPNAKPSSAK